MARFRSEPIHAFMAERIEHLMEAVSHPERVRQFVLLSHPFQLEADELTPTLKVRRQFVLRKYHDLLERLYEYVAVGSRTGHLGSADRSQSTTAWRWRAAVPCVRTGMLGESPLGTCPEIGVCPVAEYVVHRKLRDP